MSCIGFIVTVSTIQHRLHFNGLSKAASAKITSA
jgi:hypothetical protein